MLGEAYIGTPVEASLSPIPAPPTGVASNNPEDMVDDKTRRDENRAALHARREPNLEGAYAIVKRYASSGFDFEEPRCTEVRHKWRRSKLVKTIREHHWGDCHNCRNDLGKKMIENLVKASWILRSWGSDDSADVTRYEGEGALKRLNSRLRRDCDRYIRFMLTKDRYVLFVPKRLPRVARIPIWGEYPVTARAQLDMIFMSEVSPNGHAITFDKQTAAEVKAAPEAKTEWAEARKTWEALKAVEEGEAGVGDNAIETGQSPIANSPTGCASNNPDDMVSGRRFRGSPAGAGGERVEPADEPRVIEAMEALDAAEGDPDTSADELETLRVRVRIAHDLAVAEHDLALALAAGWEPWRKSGASKDGTVAKVSALDGMMLRHKGRHFSYIPKARQQEFDEFLSEVDDCTDYRAGAAS